MTPPLEKIKISFRRFANIDNDAFRAELQSVCNNILANHDTSTLASLYNKQLRDLLDRHAPRIEKTIRKRPKVAWFNANAKMLKKKVRKLEKKFRKSKKPG